MKITKINIPKKNKHNDGVEDIIMDRLDKVVLIAGKNGSGKTRILNKIFNTLGSKPTKERLIYSKNELQAYEANLVSYTSSLNVTEQNLKAQTDLTQKQKTQRAIQTLTNSIVETERQIAYLLTEQKWSLIETDIQANTYSFVNFVPKQLNLTDSNSFGKNQLLNSASVIDTVGIANLPQGAFAKIQVIQDRWFNATHQNSEVLQEIKEKAIKDYERLQQIIEIFLATKITRTINDDATLFGFPMGQSNLSDGQKILLQFCLAIFSQGESLKDLILVLDEPENHLHPSVIIETIERIQKCVTNGQIWIATHSIPLLAHFDPSQIWFVEQSKISHAGKIPEKVLGSLLGNDNEVAKLQDFISLPSQYASTRYAYESLFEPSAVMTNSSDSQSVQIRTDLLSLSRTGKLRILDYGAGKGRLISNITELDNANQNKLLDVLDYIAFDKFSTDKDLCESALIIAYGNIEKRYYNDFSKLFSDYDKESFDIVIMCNVLHEIDPKEWLKLFQASGIISNCLKETGLLLLVEDHQIPIGEKAYQKGFLVLDTPELKELFKITEKDTDFIFSDKRGDGRLKAHQIPKRLLCNISEESRIKAIKFLSSVAREKILEIREKEKNYKNGQLHGFWTQQFANAQLNLSELTLGN